QISLGHQAFVGIGACTSAYMVSRQGQPYVAGIGMAMIVGGLQALVLGAVSLRVTGLYFALVTLAYGTMAEESLFNIQSLTGGSAGQPAPKPMWFTSDLRYYYLCLAFLAAVIWVDWRLMKTKGGRALLAVRENPRVAATFGADVKVYKHGLSIPGVKTLPKEYVPIVIGPMLLLFTLTRHPGGAGQQIRPLQRWLRGGRFSFKDTHDAEVRVSDVRA